MSTPRSPLEALYQRNADMIATLAGRYAESAQAHLDSQLRFIQDLAEARTPEALMRAHTEFGSRFFERWRADLMDGRLFAAPDQAVAASPTVPDESTIQETLQRVKGIGPSYAGELMRHGVVSLGDVAQLDVDAVAEDDHPLHAMHGQMVADDWVGQARALI